MKKLGLFLVLLFVSWNVYAECKDGDVTYTPIANSTQVTIVKTESSSVDLVQVREKMQNYDESINSFEDKKSKLCKQYMDALSSGGNDNETYNCEN